ncbi:MAG: beta-ketoacyl-[acyl-carrier-protein] synthase family protein [Deltaproteobacteria bacterium]|nr:beta-ketoacyl-[acyl-carrier-protein] synthase family protein [Deltaproteobacteria bacterium]
MGDPIRVAITGWGSINALGVGVAAFEAGLRAGRCGIATLTCLPDDGYRSTVAAEAPMTALPAGLPKAVARRASRTARLALVAADEAWRMAGRGDTADVGVVLGTSTGGMSHGEESYRRAARGGLRRTTRASWLETPVSVSGDQVAALIGSHGPRLTVSTACSSGANALGLAADWIRSGRVATAVCGAAESLCRMTFSGFNALQALDRVPCRPFDRSRAGLSLGEGAAMFVFENWADAERRGVPILGEFLGYGVSADAHHLTQPRPDAAGAVLAIERALADARRAADAIDYVNAHGTGTPLNDVAEARALRTVLGTRVACVPVSSTKSQVGHCLAAAGAIEALATLLGLRGGFAPPTATLRDPDPQCALDHVVGASRSVRMRIALSNSYGFGGNNTSVVLGAA